MGSLFGADKKESDSIAAVMDSRFSIKGRDATNLPKDLVDKVDVIDVAVAESRSEAPVSLLLDSNGRRIG